MASPIQVKSVKRGDFVRFKDSDSAPVWIRGEFERSSRTYSFIRDSNWLLLSVKDVGVLFNLLNTDVYLCNPLASRIRSIISVI